MAALSFLLVITSTSLAKIGTHSSSLVCLRNMQTLSSAWTMYANDNQGLLAPNPDGSDAGKVANKPSWAGGWLDFTGSSDNTNINLLINPQNGVNGNYGGLLGPYLHSASVFKCPEDRTFTKIGGVEFARARSVSMNGYLSGIQRSNGNKYNTFANAAFQVFIKQSDFYNVDTAGIFQFIEEAPGSINDACFSVDMPKLVDSSGALTPNTFVMVNQPAAYHENRAAISFVDGHAEMWLWNHQGTTPVVSPNTSSGSSAAPNNEDIGKLALATTRRK